MNKIAEFIKSRRKEEKVESICEIIAKTPWYRRQLTRDEFIHKKAKDGKFYVQHNEWHRTIWIGPYKDKDEAEEIITSYLEESKKSHLDRKIDSKVHSLKIEDELSFF